MISSIRSWCKPAWPSHQTSRRLIDAPGTCRALFDFPDLLLSPSGPRTRVIVAARAIPDTPVKVGTIRGEHVYELFYTALPPGAFTPVDVVALYEAAGAFETVLSDEDKEQAPDRWCSHTAWGQEFWLILAQWTWNLRLELGHTLHPTPMRTTEFAPARSPESVAKPGGAVQTTTVSRPSARVGSLPHGMSRGRTLYAPARRHRPVPCWFPLISEGSSPRTRWQCTRGFCCPHRSLSSLSEA